MKRCDWCVGDVEYEQYHDQLWGKPARGEQELFAKLQLDLMQAGLSWLTILRKSDAITKAFLNFDIDKLAAVDDEPFIEELLQNEGIIRSRMKIKAVINNARAARAMRDQGQPLNEFLWEYVDNQPLDNEPKTMDDIPAKTKLSETIAKDLKAKGFTFVGPTIVYAFMQAVGLVNDHIVDCHCRNTSPHLDGI